MGRMKEVFMQMREDEWSGSHDDYLRWYIRNHKQPKKDETMKQIFSSILIKKDGEMVHSIDAKSMEYQTLINNLPEGGRIEMFIEVSGDKATGAQLKRIHAMIRQLANDIGDDFESMKLQVKKQAGLCAKDGCKSFADCDKEELNGAIQSCIAIGDMVGSNLR